MKERIPRRLAGVTLSDEGWNLLQKLREHWPDLECHRTTQTAGLSRELFEQYEGLIYVMPTGIVVRAIAPLLLSKYTDPAVVVMDVHARWVISLLSGHEGGANRLCEQVAWITGADPVVTTTSEARRTLVAGIGCRRGTPVDEILAALDTALAQVNASREDVRVLASILLKADEPGIHEAAHAIGAGVRFFHPEAVRPLGNAYGHSDFVEQTTGLPAVAEPCAMLAGSRPCLILKRIVVGKVTVALARERLSWSDSVPEAVSTAPTP